jgi:hypothetical protein
MRVWTIQARLKQARREPEPEARQGVSLQSKGAATYLGRGEAGADRRRFSAYPWSHSGPPQD